MCLYAFLNVYVGTACKLFLRHKPVSDQSIKKADCLNASIMASQSKKFHAIQQIRKCLIYLLMLDF